MKTDYRINSMDTFYSNDEQSNNKNNNNGEYHLKNFLYFLLGFFYGLTDEIDMQMNGNKTSENSNN